MNNELYEVTKPVRGAFHNRGLLMEIWGFLRVRKKWWLLPIIILLIIVGVLIIFGGAPVIGPFIYVLG